MGQKVHPNGLRVGVIRTWDSHWYSSKADFADNLIEDYQIRKFLKRKLYVSGIAKIEIEKTASKVRVSVHAAKPGVLIGKGGSEIEKIKLDVERLTGKNVTINIVEIKGIDMNAQLVAENVAAQLEKRISFRRAMKQCMGRAMKVGAKGIKIAVSGRLGGVEIARVEHYHEGTIPLQTLRADIDYGFAEANTTYGKIGVKVWIYKGEVLKETFHSGKRKVLNSLNNEGETSKERFYPEKKKSSAFQRNAINAAKENKSFNKAGEKQSSSNYGNRSSNEAYRSGVRRNPKDVNKVLSDNSAKKSFSGGNHGGGSSNDGGASDANFKFAKKKSSNSPISKGVSSAGEIRNVKNSSTGSSSNKDASSKEDLHKKPSIPSKGLASADKGPSNDVGE